MGGGGGAEGLLFGTEEYIGTPKIFQGFSKLEISVAINIYINSEVY